MRPDTKLKIDRFSFDGQEDGSERSFFSVFKGGFRAITSTVGKKNKINYHITTPATTIGIRGTDHETFVVTPDSPLATGTPVGTYNKVNLGETSMTTEKGTIFVLPNQMGYAGAADQMPRLEPVNLDIFTVSAQPSIQSRGDFRDGKPEDGRESHESASGGKSEMRENSTVDNIGIHGTTTDERHDMRDSGAIEQHELRDALPMDNIEKQESSAVLTNEAGGTSALTPSTEDAVNQTIPTTPDDLLEQEH